MRTTLDIEEKLLEEVVSVTAQPSKSGAVNMALAEYLRQVRVQLLLSHQGALDLSLDDWYEARHVER